MLLLLPLMMEALAKSREIMLFPTYGSLEGANWNVLVKGWAFEEDVGSKTNRALLGASRRVLTAFTSREKISSEVKDTFRTRAGPFLSKPLKARTIRVAVLLGVNPDETSGWDMEISEDKVIALSQLELDPIQYPFIADVQTDANGVFECTLTVSSELLDPALRLQTSLGIVAFNFA
jgi:hypothetical protein